MRRVLSQTIIFGQATTTAGSIVHASSAADRTLLEVSRMAETEGQIPLMLAEIGRMAEREG
ncbi:hypothetical protein [Paenibacillus sp. FSL H3-0469]|uniref:hypothetical protein n=1 Tax=Paenibacillus sp. FSL H3-0469 TaxID=2954506 RepID=UPI003100EF52